MEGLSPNEVATPFYIEEELVFIPIIVSYLSVDGIKRWISENSV